MGGSGEGALYLGDVFGVHMYDLFWEKQSELGVRGPEGLQPLPPHRL